MAHNFGPASRNEATLFGSSRPGYSGKNISPAEVQVWNRFMQENGIQRVVCLLPKSQLAYYREDLLESHRKAFGSDNVFSEPIEDFHLITPANLKRVLGFLKESERLSEKVVVHCSAGIGRTGLVLAAWLVYARGFGVQEGIEAIMKSEPPRNPLEAVGTHGITRDDVLDLLKSCTPTQGESHG